MLFNSLEFLVFLPVVFLIYWAINEFGIKMQNVFLILVSYFFYGWWDVRFLSLIVFSSLVDYLVGIYLSKASSAKGRKLLLFVSIFVNLGFLGFFKYYNFFIESFVEAFSFFGHHANPYSLKIILPVGISFYTFQTLSYSIDVYRKKMEPTRDIAAFFAYVSFFPQLVAGPIERATNLLPQFFIKRSFNYSQSVDGLRQILWGFFKKVVIADNCAEIVNDIFLNHHDLNGSTLVIGSFLFAFQIYGDFSGYSDIAIGTARLFGFNLMRNFAYPYFSRDISEFWRRWHISLSTWFRDYLYIPLGGSKGGVWMKIRNTFIIFIVSGFWHGANWTFIIWGFLNAIYFLPYLLTNMNRRNLDIVAKYSFFPTFKELFQMGFTFVLTLIAWIFFRSEDVGSALVYLNNIFSLSLFNPPEINPIEVYILIAILVVIEWIGRRNQHALELKIPMKRVIRWAIYFFVFYCIMVAGNFNKTEFIYFDF